MAYENNTLGELLSDERIAPIAGYAIRNWDLSKEDVWGKTLSQIRDEHLFAGKIGDGFERLYKAADTGEWYYPLYSEAECAEEPARKGVNIVWFPSEESGADERPYILVIPGGGFVNVWNLSEGWPVAAQFNKLGYHVFILTYQVDGDERLLDRNVQDISKALWFIKENEQRFHLNGGKYITCGFSAGGYLVCLWNTAKGYPAFDLPKPCASFPIYPVTGLQADLAENLGAEEEIFIRRLCGCSVEEAVECEFETTKFAGTFPPCAFFLAGDDSMVDPDNSRNLAKALEDKNIPYKMEIGPEGGHGFADGTGMCMEGWTERAVKWYESLIS